MDASLFIFHSLFPRWTNHAPEIVKCFMSLLQQTDTTYLKHMQRSTQSQVHDCVKAITLIEFYFVLGANKVNYCHLLLHLSNRILEVLHY